MGKSYIIGASGLIGWSLYNLLEKKSKVVLGTYTNNKEDGLLNFDLKESDFSCFKGVAKADVFYLLSAYSNPTWIAQNKLTAEELNFTKTIRFIDFLIKKRIKIIFMSSVEVFDGQKGGYSEEDSPNPLNFYGELKLKVEEYLISNYDNYTIVRTGWNVGLNKKSRCVVQLTYETLLNDGAKMATDNFFSLSSVEDTAEGLYRASLRDDLKKIHICSEEIVNRKDMANLIINESRRGVDMSFSECLFEEIQYSEPRGRVNDLKNSLSRNLMGMTYLKANELIKRKVKYLDKAYG
jgi:dTDP-4-dehydrorhamnose reductase